MSEQKIRSLKARIADKEVIRLHCNDCGRDRNVLLSAIVPAADIEADTSYRELKRRLRCSRCNGKNVEMMTPSHRTVPLPDDRVMRIQSNVEGVQCPKCGTKDVYRSGAVKRPYRLDGKVQGGLAHEYECEVCGNWWTGP